MEIKYLGHSGFKFTSQGYNILVDPWKCSNENYNSISDILLTHGHFDHAGLGIELSKQNKTKVTAVFELANYINSIGGNAEGVSLGGWLNFDWGKAIFLPAFHSSSTPDGHYAGCAAGILLEIEDKRIFHAGDTCLNSEMQVLREIYHPDIAILPIGGHYTMDIENSVIAANLIGAETVIPMHYNTFEAIRVDITQFDALIKEQGKTPKIFEIGESTNL